jgi:peptidoglycan-associated lipoprotein
VPFDGTGGTSPGAGRLPGSDTGVGGTDLNNGGAGLGNQGLNPNLDSRNKLENREIFANDNVYFDFDKFNVKPQYTANINKVADYLKAHPTDSLLVEGHTDDRGTEEYNLALGERRALSVRDRLISAGVSGDRITTISYGKEKPAVIGNTEEAHAKNRRGVFVLLSNPAALQ